MTNLKNVDRPSSLGSFGWERIGASDDFAIPVIVRSNNIRYSPVRIVEQEIIKRYEALPQAVFQCITLKSFYLTNVEAKLLNSINFNHCNVRYGEAFFDSKDVIISASDVKELSRFLNISHVIFTQNITEVSQHLGIVRFRINPENAEQTLLMPYIIKAYNDKQVRFIPYKMVEAYVNTTTTSVRGPPNDWDVMYLKMLSIYCQNNSQGYISKGNPLVPLDGLVYSKTNTPIIYEDYKSPTI